MKPIDVTIYTIGHSNHSIEHFIEILKKNEICLLVDVRSIPYSKYTSQFNKKNLSHELQSNGFEYIWMGDLLGGLEANGMKVCLDADRDRKYSKGIDMLIQKAIEKNTTIMCSEEDPHNCHRHKIIVKKYFSRLPEEQYNLVIKHIRGKGDVETVKAISEQLEMF
jgi:uncharacterized protein (DUF488 family)